MDLADRAIRVVSDHPAISRVELAGSRARGTQNELSDWDFAVQTTDLAAVARALPDLVEPLRPLAKQWEPLGHFPAYMLMLRGPTKVEYLFLEHSQEPKPPVVPTARTLQPIDDHFWDWIWWIATKVQVDRNDLVRAHWPLMFAHILRPMGATQAPHSVASGVRTYLRLRRTLEKRFHAAVSGQLEREVRSGLRELGHAF